MRLVVIGSHGTGKTTLLNEMMDHANTFGVSSPFIDHVFKSGLTRQLKADGFAVNEDAGDSTQIAAMNMHFKNKVYGNMISDRSAIDCFCYTTHLYKQGKLSAECWDLQYAQMISLISTYDYIFYIKPEFAVIQDDVRPACTDFQAAIADEFEFIIDALSIPVIPLSGTVEQRLATILAMVS